MKSNMVASNPRISSQKPEAEKRSPSAAVQPRTIAGASVRTDASIWTAETGCRARRSPELARRDEPLGMADGVAVIEQTRLAAAARAGSEEDLGQVVLHH